MTRDLQPGQAGAEAEVGAEAEGDVLVRGAGACRSERIVEHGFVAVGRRVEQHQLVPLVDLRSVELDVVGGRADHVPDRGDPPEHLLDGGRSCRSGSAARRSPTFDGMATFDLNERPVTFLGVKS